jgi:hypothetical protein
MPSLGVQHCLRDFEDNLDNALNMLAESSTYRIPKGLERSVSISSRRKELFAALALLRMHIAWEDFIERSFLRYLCGAYTTSGYSPILLNAPFRTIDNAFTTILAGHQYINWNPAKIENLARTYFNSGDPFVSAVSPARNKLTEINDVRNRFAHRSESASQKFEFIVQSVFGFVPRGINPGRYLLMTDPLNPSLRFIDSYAVILRVTARSIVH